MPSADYGFVSQQLSRPDSGHDDPEHDLDAKKIDPIAPREQSLADCLWPITFL